MIRKKSGSTRHTATKTEKPQETKAQQTSANKTANGFFYRVKVILFAPYFYFFSQSSSDYQKRAIREYKIKASPSKKYLHPQETKAQQTSAYKTASDFLYRVKEFLLTRYFYSFRQPPSDHQKRQVRVCKIEASLSRKYLESNPDHNELTPFHEQYFDNFFGYVSKKLDTNLLNKISENDLDKFLEESERDLLLLCQHREKELRKIQERYSPDQLISNFDEIIPSWYQARFSAHMMHSALASDKIPPLIEQDIRLLQEIPRYCHAFCTEVSSIAKSEDELYEKVASIKEFCNIKKQDMWRLFIDGKDHEIKGKLGYENEPGYLNGCYKGFSLGLEMIHDKRKFSCDSLLEIYKKTVESAWTFKPDAACMLKLTPEFREDKYPPLSGKTNPLSLPLVLGRNASEQGIQEIKNNSVLNDDGEYEHKHYKYHIKVSGHLAHLEYGRIAIDDEITQIVNELFEECYKVIESQVNSNDVKQEAISYCIAQLERMHLFPDGNCRTCVVILGNLLRIQCGLSPVIWHDPNVFDGFSIQELTQLQTQAAESYKKLLQDT